MIFFIENCVARVLRMADRVRSAWSLVVWRMDEGGPGAVRKKPCDFPKMMSLEFGMIH